MYGIIDIGSNTIRLSVYKVEQGEIETMFNKRHVAGLAGYVDDDNNLSEKGIQKAIDVMNSFRKIINNIQVKGVFPFATASLRNIDNSEYALERIKKESGFDIQLLSGVEEARYDYRGAIRFVKQETGMLVDIGGGSTELVFFKDNMIISALSLPVGSLNMYNKHVTNLLPTEKDGEAIEKAVKKELDKIGLMVNKEISNHIVGVGGSIRASNKLNNYMNDLPKDNRTFEVKQFKKLINSFKDENKKNLQKILQVVPERIHTLLPGMYVLKAVCNYYDSQDIVISEHGVREGYLYYILGEE